MLYLFRLLFLLINIDQETVLNWFGIEDSRTLDIPQSGETIYDFAFSNVETSTEISLTTFRLILEGLWQKFQGGLTLSDIEHVLFLIIFIRFVVLILRYNLKTSFYITCIGLFAGYLWYRHLIDLISMYKSLLIKIPFVHKLGQEALRTTSIQKQLLVRDSKFGYTDSGHWYNPGQVLYSAVSQGSLSTDPETGMKYYIDPLSMVVANLNEPLRSTVVPYYYKLYNSVIPKIHKVFSQFWRQLSSVAAYATITRIGKRYCPYLVRWHWTFLLIMGMVEQFFVYFVYRIYYFYNFIILPQIKGQVIEPNLLLQAKFLGFLLSGFVLVHIGFVIFGLLHASLGQYFYIPFFVENTELHIGPRPTNSIYSGGYTAWQDSKEKNTNRLIPKLWYGWFGRGTQNKWLWLAPIIKRFKQMIKKLR
jgi:hypothetical protein